MDRTRADAALERGEGEARQYLQGRQSLLAAVARGGCDGGHPLCRAQRYQEAMARAVDGAANSQGCGGCGGGKKPPPGVGAGEERGGGQGGGGRPEKKKEGRGR